MLQVYPFIIIICASAFRQLRKKLPLLLVVLCVWLAAATLLSFPNYLSFHNEIVSDADWLHAFADPNVELGQNLDALTAYLMERNLSSAKVKYYQKEHVREYWPVQFENFENCSEGMLVVDTVSLHIDPALRHLLCRRPVDVVRGSIFVYNVTNC